MIAVSVVELSYSEIGGGGGGGGGGLIHRLLNLHKSRLLSQ